MAQTATAFVELIGLDVAVIETNQLVRRHPILHQLVVEVNQGFSMWFHVSIHDADAHGRRYDLGGKRVHFDC